MNIVITRIRDSNIWGMSRCKSRLRRRLVVLLSPTGMTVMYTTLCKIYRLRQTVGCVYQYHRRSPRFHINTSITLRLYGITWRHFHLISSPSCFFWSIFSPLCLISLPLSLPSFYLFFISLFALANRLPPAFSLCSFISSSSSFCSMPPFTSHPVCVCLVYHCSLI